MIYDAKEHNKLPCPEWRGVRRFASQSASVAIS